MESMKLDVNLRPGQTRPAFAKTTRLFWFMESRVLRCCSPAWTVIDYSFVNVGAWMEVGDKFPLSTVQLLNQLSIWLSR